MVDEEEGGVVDEDEVGDDEVGEVVDVGGDEVGVAVAVEVATAV